MSTNKLYIFCAIPNILALFRAIPILTICAIPLVITVCMQQVLSLSKFAIVGWGGFNDPKPTRDEVIKAIDGMPKKYKGFKKVLIH